MTVASQTSRVSYAGNGSTILFAVPFYFLENGHLRVVLRSSAGVETIQIITTNYTVTGAGNPAGGSITMTVAPASGETLVIARNVPVTQETDYQANDPFPAESHERALDKLTMIAQQSDDTGNRAIKIPETETNVTQVPASATRANKLLGFTNGGDVALSTSTIAQVDAAVSSFVNTTGNNAASILYDPAGTGAQQTTVQAKLRETIVFEDFGAVGDGVADDTIAINAAFAAASNSSTTVYGTGGKTYRITSTINISGKRFDGRNCSILKDFSGTGIYITGGAAYSYLSNFVISAASSYQPTDYDASATDHGIHVQNTRVEMFDITSSGHNGSGFYLNQISPNANKSKYIRIAAGGCAFAGCFVDGNYPTADDFSVVEFNGRFQSNWGYGMYSSATAPMRQWDCWIYSESNHDGASAPNDGGIRLERAMTCDFWIYSEESGREFVLGTNASRNIARSVRQNRDDDFGSENMWKDGAYFYKPDSVTPRNTELSGFRGPLVRVGTPGEDVHIPLIGSGGNFGYWYGEGQGSNQRQFGFKSYDKSTRMFVTISGGFVVGPKLVYGARENFELLEFGLVETTANQITVTITVRDTVSKYGTGMIELWLSGDTDTSSNRIYHLCRIPFAARGDTNLATFDSETVVQSNGFTIDSATTSGLTLTLVYDVNAVAVAVSGYAKSLGGTASIVSASLS